MKRLIKILLLVFLCFMALVCFQNLHIATHVFEFKLNLFFFKLDPVGVYNAGIIGSAFLLGVVIFFLAGLALGKSSKSMLKQERKNVKNLEEEVKSLEKRLMEEKMERFDDEGSRGMFRTPG